MHSRMVERGVDLQTEHKISQWRRDVASEMHHLQTQLEQHRTKDEDDNTSYSLVKDIHEL